MLWTECLLWGWKVLKMNTSKVNNSTKTNKSGSWPESLGDRVQPAVFLPSEEKSERVADIVRGYETPHEGWESYQVKKILMTEYEKWILNLASWKSLITLTFEEEKTPDVARSLFNWFVRKLNKHAFGSHYTQKVGHSYFSYVVGLERQTRDVVHFHALVDKPLDFNYLHKLWGSRCGFAWVDGSIHNRVNAIRYVCKYTVKGGELDTYKSNCEKVPSPLPLWWKTADLPSRVHLGRSCPGELAQPLTVYVQDNLFSG